MTQLEQDLSRVLAWLDRSTAMDHDDANHEAAQFLSSNRDSIKSALADQRRWKFVADLHSAVWADDVDEQIEYERVPLDQEGE